MKLKKIGVLAFHGDVIEHIRTTEQASKNLHLDIEVLPIRTNKYLSLLDGLIIPGGESTTLFKLCEREKMWEGIKKVKNIFGTCAGAIMLAKKVDNKLIDQKTLELIDIRIDRNAYGRQTESFEKNIKSLLGKIHAVFIRAPKIVNIGKNIKVLAKIKDEIVACEQREKSKYYLVTCFHPELATTLYHEYFLKNI